jgi:VanZ family protein
MQTGSDSSGFSLEMTTYVKQLLNTMNIYRNEALLHTWIRMSGHIIQYVMFGYFSLWMIVIYHLKWYNIFRTSYMMILDETIQFFTPDRAAELVDILLDSIGVIIAYMIFSVTRRIFVKHGG